MKLFKLDEEAKVNGGKLSYMDLARACLNRVDPTDGLDLGVMRKRIRVLDALDNHIEDVAHLEDADADVLVLCVRNMKWAVVDKSILAFADAVEEACK